MYSYNDLKDFFKNQNLKFIIAADAQPRTAVRRRDKIVNIIPAGGVSIALDPIARASNAIYIGRGKTEEDKKVSLPTNRLNIENENGNYILKRIFLTEEELDGYYYGFSNQTLWPLCHATFERPEFRSDWYDTFKKVNQKFAESIKRELTSEKTFIWINDYQLSLVPYFLDGYKNVTSAMFWHIPWPTWEIFRILPHKSEILKGMLRCDFIGFHRGYHVRNFIDTVERELEARVDDETNTIFFEGRKTMVNNIPMGIDVDIVRSLVKEEDEDSSLKLFINNLLNVKEEKEESLYDKLFKENKVILGVDRLDYTKGLYLRLQALQKFFEKYPKYIGKVVYLGIIAPSREKIPSYQILKKEIKNLAMSINDEYGTKDWKPIQIVSEVFTREEIMNFYKNADLCLVTPRDDGMNLVSKEFIVASSLSKDPGMLVLSRFAGSAIDLTEALIVNPYNIDEVAESIKKGLEMDKKEKIARIKSMVETLEENNVYKWAENFVKEALKAGRENK